MAAPSLVADWFRAGLPRFFETLWLSSADRIKHLLDQAAVSA
jgi:hypothetical protein